MYDVIVVGLGAAGAMACNVLDRCNQSVLVLEASGRLGGRIHTEEFGDSLVELGAEWIHGTTQNTVYKLAVERNFDVKPQILMHMVFSSNGEVDDSDTLHDLWEYSFGLLTHPPAEAQPLGQYLTERIKEYAAANLPDILEEENGYLDKFLRWMNLIIGNHESCDNWNDVSTLTDYEDLDGSPYISWHKLGYKTLFDILVEPNQLKSAKIKFNAEVVNIKMPAEPCGPVTVTCRDGEVYHSRSVILTVSLGVLKERHETLFEPPLPQRKVRVIEHLSIGVVNKVILLFEKAWWPTEVSCIAFLWRPEELADIPESDMWVTNVFGASLTMGNDDCLVFWLSGQEAKLVETLPDAEVQGKLMWLLRKFVGNYFTVSEPIDMKRSSWYQNPFTRGSYSFDNINTPDFPDARNILAEPITDCRGIRILFAGEATDKTHFSTVHGALDSGYREADRYIRFECPGTDASAFG